MTIHVVQADETIPSIAEKYQMSTFKLIQDNELVASGKLATGQTLVIAAPEEIYTVQTDDTLSGIAASQQISMLQLLRNNPFLSDREYIYPGETLVIRYPNKDEKITTIGYTYPFIDKNVLEKTLPYLTYLSVFNYQVTTEGEVIEESDEDIVKLAWSYGVAPLMLVSTLSSLGVPNIEVAFNVLLNEGYQNRLIDRILEIMKKVGYYGLNIVFLYLNTTTQKLYENLIIRISSRLKKEGFPVFVTIKPLIQIDNNDVKFETADYSVIGTYADEIVFLSFNWGTEYSPPVPNSLFMSNNIFDYIVTQMPPEKADLGLSVIGYDWQLPYQEGSSKATSLTFNHAVELARNVDAVIQYDSVHQAAYFKYQENNSPNPIQHIVWFKDARSVDSLAHVVQNYHFNGIGVWNIMQYFAQMWLVINTQYDIENLLL